MYEIMISDYEKSRWIEKYENQLLQRCTARTAWSDSLIKSETSLITESDQRWQMETRLPRGDQWKAEKSGAF